MHRTGKPVYCCEEEHVRELSAVPIHGFKNRFQTFQWLENEFTNAGFSIKRRCRCRVFVPYVAWRLSIPGTCNEFTLS